MSPFARRVSAALAGLVAAVCVVLAFTSLSIGPLTQKDKQIAALEDEIKALRMELVLTHATLCQEQLMVQSQGENTILKAHLRTKERAVEACLATAEVLANRLADQAGDNRKQNCTIATSNISYSNVKPFKPTKSREVLDWESFDRGYVYSWKLYWRVNGHQGNLRKELQEAITESKKFVDAEGYTWQHGQYQIDTRRGITYLMDFEKVGNGEMPTQYKRIQMIRPISSIVYPLSTPAESAIDPQYRTVHIIMPLKGRALMFIKFLTMLSRMTIYPSHPGVFLTVVYFYEEHKGQELPIESSAEDELQIVRKALEHITGLKYRLMVVNEKFSRGLGLQRGASARVLDLPHGLIEEVLFFCDVDMVFTEQFLYRCRANAIPGTTAYFPVPFSLFKTASNVSVIHSNGDWRKYGLGMVCMSFSDFQETGGYNSSITGWGREDVDFYERVIKAGRLDVVRSVDNGLVHRWHEKECKPEELSKEQMNDCLRSRADWEGDKLHLVQQYESQK